MSAKNLFFLKNEINISGISALNNFDPNIKIRKIKDVILPKEMNGFEAYTFDDFHINGGVSQMNFNSIESMTVNRSDKISKSSLYGMLSKSFQNEQEALKIKFIIFYIILYLNFDIIGVTAVDNTGNNYKFNCNDFNIDYLSVWKLHTNSLLDLARNTILMIQ